MKKKFQIYNMTGRIIKRNLKDRESATILSVLQDGRFSVISNITGDYYVWEGSYIAIQEMTGFSGIEEALENIDKLTCVKKELRGTTYFSNN